MAGLEPKQAYVLALAAEPDGSGKLEALSSFVTNPAGGAVVNAVGPIRQIVSGNVTAQRRYLVIAPGMAGAPGKPVQVQVMEAAQQNGKRSSLVSSFSLRSTHDAVDKATG